MDLILDFQLCFSQFYIIILYYLLQKGVDMSDRPCQFLVARFPLPLPVPVLLSVPAAHACLTSSSCFLSVPVAHDCLSSSLALLTG